MSCRACLVSEAVVADYIVERMLEFRLGRSVVVERGHVVLVGWTERTIPCILELCLSNESEGGGVVVVLGDYDKVTPQQLCKVPAPREQTLTAQTLRWRWSASFT